MPESSSANAVTAKLMAAGDSAKASPAPTPPPERTPAAPSTAALKHLLKQKPRLSLTFRTAVLSDAGALSRISARAFAVGHPVSQADIDAYVRAHFGVDHFEADLRDPHKSVFLACDNIGAPVAFAVLHVGTSDEYIAHLERTVEVQRIYADPDYHGTGAAKALMEYTLTQAKARGFKYAWLGAWEGNRRAQAFYAKLGFHKVGSRYVMVGNDKHGDDILVREL